MNIYIPSFSRPQTIRTHKLLAPGTPFHVILHSEAEKGEYLKYHPELEPFIKVSGLPPGISAQRNWIIDNLMEEGEWGCFMDDNIRHFNKFPDEVYSLTNLPYEASKRYAWEHNYIDSKGLMECLEETVDKSDDLGVKYCGFASIDNAFFRKKKFKNYSLIVAKMSLIKKTKLRYDEKISCIDDYEMSIKQIIEYGKVLVNSYVRPVSQHCEAGGLGKLTERAPKKQADVKYLMEKYPGLLRIKNRKNSLEGCEVNLRYYTENGINNWRESWLHSQNNK